MRISNLSDVLEDRIFCLRSRFRDRIMFFYLLLMQTSDSAACLLNFNQGRGHTTFVMDYVWFKNSWLMPSRNVWFLGAVLHILSVCPGLINASISSLGIDYFLCWLNCCLVGGSNRSINCIFEEILRSKVIMTNSFILVSCSMNNKEIEVAFTFSLYIYK